MSKTARAALAMAAAPSLQSLVACVDGAGPTDRNIGDYGPLTPAGPELELPADFSYQVLSFSGDPMSNGQPTPGAFDGMAAFPLSNGNIRLVRNHENRDTPATARVKGDVTKAYDPKGGGGTTSLEIGYASDGSLTVLAHHVSLCGTIVNCAGGPTPWGSWLTCEETTAGPSQGWTRKHGYVFEVPGSAVQEVSPVPLKAMGRFVHEAVAVDPSTGIVYETEDQPVAGFYRFLPAVQGQLTAGGSLQMLAVAGSPNLDTRKGIGIGDQFEATWLDIADPDPEMAATDPDAVFAQGYAQGAAIFGRLEGCWYGDGSILFHSTNGGAAGLGQVWMYRPDAPDRGVLMLLFESLSIDVLDSPDNITVSPRGGVVICEDGGGVPYLRGLTGDGRVFSFAKNTLNSTEFAGACFSPDGRALFVNIQGATRDAGTARSATLAITGPWQNGSL